MPIHLDIMDNEFIGPLIRQKVEEALVNFLLPQMEKRFARVSARIKKRLSTLNSEQLEVAGLRLLDAQRLEDLFGQ